MKRKLVSLFVVIMLLIGLMGVPVQAASESEIEDSILDGLEWLADEQDDVTGSWGSYYPIAETAFAVLKFHSYAIETGQLVDGKIVEMWRFIPARSEKK